MRIKDMAYGKFALVCCQMLVLTTSVNAMDFDLMSVATDKDNKKDNANLQDIYNDKWESHYEQHNIIDVLRLNKDKYAESIENIRNIGLSSVQNYVNYKNRKMRYLYLLGENPDDIMDALIVTNIGDNEDISDYLMRQEVKNLNYILLENLMMRICVAGTIYNTDEQLDFLMNKIEKKLASIKDGAMFERIMTKVRKSKNDVKTYVEVGALDEFMQSFGSYLKSGDDSEGHYSDLECEEENEELQNSFEQSIQDSIDKEEDKSININMDEEDEGININTEEGKKITANLIKSMYKLSEKILAACSKDDAELRSIARGMKQNLNEFKRVVKGGVISGTLDKILGIEVSSWGDEDDERSKWCKEKGVKFEGGSLKPLKMMLRLSEFRWRFFENLERSEDKIPDVWFTEKTKKILEDLMPYLQKYILENAEK